MLPSRRQYDKWSVPSKWSFWAGIIGIPVGLVSLTISFLPFLSAEPTGTDRRLLLLQVAQELRYNDEWLSMLAVASRRRAPQVPIGYLKTEALVTLIQREYDSVVRVAYGGRQTGRHEDHHGFQLWS